MKFNQCQSRFSQMPIKGNEQVQDGRSKFEYWRHAPQTTYQNAILILYTVNNKKKTMRIF